MKPTTPSLCHFQEQTLSDRGRLVLLKMQHMFIFVLLLFIFRVLKHKKTVTSTVVISVLMILAYNLDGTHQEVYNLMLLLPR